MSAADGQVPIAVVGMDCVLPGAADPASWARRTTPALSPIPAERWPGTLRHDPIPGRPGATVAAQGAFVEVPPLDLEGLRLGELTEAELDPLHILTLHTTRGALRGLTLPRERTVLILANLALPGSGMARALAGPLRGRLAAPPPWLREVPPWHRHHAASPALLAAHALQLGGGATALDAACASGLYAVQLGCARLAAGEVDAVIAGAVQRADLSWLFLGFTQLRALSPGAVPRPLDRRADGLVVGEGAGAVALQRLDDALAAGHPILAVIRGGSLGNDGRKGNLLAPDAKGQLRVLRQAWERAGISPSTLGYVECHATGTPLGDRVEVEALHHLLQQAGHRGPPIPLTSTKALIGHTITTAGMAGLIRAIGAIARGTIPAGAEDPIAALTDSPHLTCHPEPTPWPDGPRRVGVSAFGFGGTNAHLVVEGFDPDRTPPSSSPSIRPPPAELAVVGLSLRLGPLEHEAAWSALKRQAPLLAAAPPGAGRGDPLPEGLYIDGIDVDPRRWRIPPIELADLLPQQLLALETAADAAHPLDLEDARVGCILGMEVDPSAADVVLREAILPFDPDLADALTSPLTAARVQGALPNFVANRISSQLDLDGPSYTVSAGALSGLVALEQAARLLADGLDAVVVGAVDLPGHPSLSDRPVAEGAVVFVLSTPQQARSRGWPVWATLDVKLRAGTGPLPAHRPRIGHGGAADGLIALADQMARGPGTLQLGEGGLRAEVQISSASDALPPRAVGDRVLHVPRHPGPLPPRPGWLGGWGQAHLPRPLPRRQPAPEIRLEGPTGALVPLRWPTLAPASPRTKPASPRTAPPPSQTAPTRPHTAQASPPRQPASPRTAPPPSQTAPIRPHTAPASLSRGLSVPAPRPGPPAHPGLIAQELQGLSALAAGMAQATDQLASTHARFLDGERRAADQLAQLAAQLAHLVRGEPLPRPHEPLQPLPEPVQRPPAPQMTPPQPETTAAALPKEALKPIQPATSAPTPPPTPAPGPLLDQAALLRHATGTLAETFGPEWADLDRFEPRVRMPYGELLLVSRVLTLEGARGSFGPSRIVTEYDLPTDRDWSPDGRPPPCVLVESGQADLLLVSWLGVDEICRGERVYRLLDCDLTFHGEVPAPGETLRHDIRIDRFARLGDTTLFYFHYDCVAASDGRPILSMRNGCAGFFTREELRQPKGIDTTPDPLPTPAPVRPLIPGCPTSLDDEAVRLLAAGRASAALGPAFAAADDARLTLAPSDRWRLVHRVTHLTHRDGAHGLGEVVYEQDLRDDDWFNPIHFQGDPCMPGTLMFDGCTQAVQVWLLGLGAAAHWPDARFEPLPGRTASLRCRGQVVPGHKRLVYRARITEAGLDPTPWAVADVILEVDGIPVVRARGVGVRVTGTHRGERPRFDLDQVLEYSVGSAERALGPAWAPYDQPPLRCSRMPGLPYLTMSRVISVEGETRVEATPRTVVIEWDVPEESWYFRDDPVGALPFAMLLEGALQPCGWLTAWQGAPISKGDRYFRNLGGTLTQHAEILPGTKLRTRTTQINRSVSGEMTLVGFVSEMFDGAQKVVSCESHFGYFTAESLRTQKGLPLSTEEAERRRQALQRDQIPPTAPLGAPGGEWALLDHLIAANPNGGAHGRGFYAAQSAVDPSTWFFVAHFHQDPVMPGSLGLEGLLQLARHALLDQVGADLGEGRFQPIELEHEVRWTYRGQVHPSVKEVRFELDVQEILSDADGVLIRADGWVWADALPIYRFEDIAVRWTPDLPVPPLAAPRRRPPGPSALLDRFTADGNTGYGVLHLDPELHPWLDQHRPTLTAAAVPLAFAAEIAAEAASLLCPDLEVVGLPKLQAERWIHTGEGPVDLQIAAVREGDLVAVTLAIHTHNPRFPHLSGPRPHMRAVVQMGTARPSAPLDPLAQIDADQAQDIGAYYAGGHTFHGPLLQAMTSLRTGPHEAEATLLPRPDEDLLGEGQPAFLLDPLLLDAATHPMWSSAPERWIPGLKPGYLAYPVGLEGLRLFGPRPTGPVRCALRAVRSDTQTLVFDISLGGEAGLWCTYRWTEAVVQAGILLGQPPEIRRAMLWDRRPVSSVRVGRPVGSGGDGSGWEVRLEDLHEPLAGTTAGLLCDPAELQERRQAEDPRAWDLGRMAAKEAVRSWIQQRLGRDVHPRDLKLYAMRPDLYVVLEAPTLSAQEYVDHLGPTRFDLRVEVGPKRARAQLLPR